MTVKPDPSRNAWLSETAINTLLSGYCDPGEGPQDAFARAASAFSAGDNALAQRLYDYVSKGWFMFATPLLANGGKASGLPISCFLNYVEDSVEGLVDNLVENAMLSTQGGGIGSYWGAVRSVGESTRKGLTTPGAMPFMHVQDAQVLAYHQGKTRRGAMAAYMDISHPEIVEFINMRSSTGGDVHRKNENLHHGVCLSDAFMEAVEADQDWNLVDPHSGRVAETVKARALWVQLLQRRAQLGEPYLFFKDNANKALRKELRDAGDVIHHTNLCTEIMLPTSVERTAVCCLSSINLAKWDEYQDQVEQVVDDLMVMLDNTLQVFIGKASGLRGFERAVRSAVWERSVGLGALGLFTYFQSKGWVAGDEASRKFNREVFKTLHDLSLKASKRLAKERGAAPALGAAGQERFSHRMAVAPNATSSIILNNVSPSVEPLVANCFTQKNKQGSVVVKNALLQKYLADWGFDTDEVWGNIAQNQGSVVGLAFLPDSVKAIFRTAAEIDPSILVELAADRQPFIDQGQSVNLFFSATEHVRTVSQVHMKAWKLGLKALYYMRSSSVRTTKLVSPPVQTEGTCTACEG